MMRRESDEDFCLPKPPAAPGRPEKKGDVQSLPIVSVGGASSSVFPSVKEEKDTGSEPTSDCCAVCSKNLSHLNDLRKVAHVNKCLDAQESTRNHEKAKDKWSSTIDCPMCGEPQPPGPHRSAHAKRCGKIYNIAPKELLRLMETQRRVSDAKKRHNMLHTKAPAPQKKEVLPPKLQGAPNSLLDENLQLAKALSASMDAGQSELPRDSSPQFTRIFDPNEKRRKRPRSYALVELAPRSCKCEVIQKIHDRFLETFHLRKTSGPTVSHSEFCQRRTAQTSIFMQSQARLFQKLERLERLSEDLYSLVGQESTSDVRIQCCDGDISAHRLLLRLRTRLLSNCASQSSSTSVEVRESKKTVMMWLRFVYSGRVEWEENFTKDMLNMAEQYGPEDLLTVCSRMLLPLQHEESVATQKPTHELCSEDFSSADIAVQIPSAASTSAHEEHDLLTKTTTCQPSVHNVEIIVPEELRVSLSEPTTTSAASEQSDTTVDNEDPLQGIVFDQSSVRESSEDDCVVVSDASSTSEGQGSGKGSKSGSECSQPRTGECDLQNCNVGPLSDRDAEMQSAGEEEEITMVEMPQELDASQASTSSHSPDLFDEKSNDSAQERGSAVELTPLRPPSLTRMPSTTQPTLDYVPRNETASADSTVEAGSLRRSCLTPMECSPEVIVAGVPEGNLSEGPGSEDDVVCLGEQAPQRAASADRYANEYFDYHDPFMEPWYDAAETSFSQPVVEQRRSSIESPSVRVARRRTSGMTRRSLTANSVRAGSGSPVQANPVEENVVETRLPVVAASQDSFFDTPVFLDVSANEPKKTTVANGNQGTADPSTTFITPLGPAKKKAKFGSNVKVLKTSGITPMPNYEGMTDDELKRELAKFGLKPMGRRRAVSLLKQIYTEVHPEIDPFTPTVRPLLADNAAGNSPISSRPAKAGKPLSRSKAIVMPKDTTEKTVNPPVTTQVPLENLEENEDEDFIDIGEKTLNEPRDEPLEETMIDDTGLPPKDLDGMIVVFLAWLRQPNNVELYNHMLSLQPVLIDELHLRMSRADSAVCGIPKKALANILDRLGVTFSLPQVNGGRRAAGARK